VDFDYLTRTLRMEEGVKKCAYKDHLGLDTIGIGFLVDASVKGAGIPDVVMNFWLETLLRECVDSLIREIQVWSILPDNVQNALVLMRYQLGMPRLRGFKKMLIAIELGNWQDAAAEALDSKWAKQTPARADRVAALMMGD
jgi:lysozyme